MLVVTVPSLLPSLQQRGMKALQWVLSAQLRARTTQHLSSAVTECTAAAKLESNPRKEEPHPAKGRETDPKDSRRAVTSLCHRSIAKQAERSDLRTALGRLHFSVHAILSQSRTALVKSLQVYQENPRTLPASSCILNSRCMIKGWGTGRAKQTSQVLTLPADPGSSFRRPITKYPSTKGHVVSLLLSGFN